MARSRVDLRVQRHCFAGKITAELPRTRVDPRQSRRIEETKAGVGRRDQIAATLGLVQSHADVARRGVHVASLEQTAPDAADFIPGLSFGHASIEKALLKKSSAPKLPDFSAKCRSTSGTAWARAWHQGTPGSICGPIFICVMFKACTQAPAVSPPATTSWRTPTSTRSCATAASAFSNKVPA